MGSTAAGASGGSGAVMEDDLINQEDFGDLDQLLILDGGSGEGFDILEWHSGCDLGDAGSDDEQLENEIQAVAAAIQRSENSSPDKQKFDSRTYVRPKKRAQRPSIHTMVEGISSFADPPGASTDPSGNRSADKFLTYNKYNTPVSPMLRLKTFNVEAGTENSNAVKDYAMKRRSLNLDEEKMTEVEEPPELSSPEHTLSKPINIDFSQPAHNLHTTFTRGMSGIMSGGFSDRDSLSMFRSGNSFINMSPPSLVNSLIMETSTRSINPESLRSQRDSGAPTSARESLGPHSMLDSMTISIMDDKDMSTSFLSQSTYQENDSLIGSLPPSLAGSVNSSYDTASGALRHRPDASEHGLISSGTFTTLVEPSERLMSRPRAQMYKNFPRMSDTFVRKSESYTKSKCDYTDSTNSPKQYKASDAANETINIHFSNNRFSSEEKENEFQKDDAFHKDMQKADMQRTIDLGRNNKRIDMQRTVDLGRNSLNVTVDKQELNEIIQARQKLSLARNTLPKEPQFLPNQIERSPNKTIQLVNQTINLANRTLTMQRPNGDNSTELLSRRKMSSEEPQRDTPKRNATFKKPSPKANNTDATMIYVKTDESVDVNSANVNFIDSGNRTLQREEWASEERAMVGSSDSTDTATLSSCSPPDAAPACDIHERNAREQEIRLNQVASTPLGPLKKGPKETDLLLLHHAISPIFDDPVKHVANLNSSGGLTMRKSPSKYHENAYRHPDSPYKNPDSTYKYSDSNYRYAESNYRSPDGTYKRRENAYQYHENVGEIPAQYCDRTEAQNASIINTATIVRRPVAKKDFGNKNADGRNMRPPSRLSPTAMAPPPTSMPRKTGLPTSKLRQYSSHKELSRIPGAGAPPARVSQLAGGGRGGIQRRGVYASNPALSPTAPAPPAPPPAPVLHRRDSYTISVHAHEQEEADATMAERRSPSPRAAAPVPALVRQGTETLRRPHSQLVTPRDIRCGSAEGGPNSYVGIGSVLLRNKAQMQGSSSRPSSIASLTQLRVRPNVPTQKPVPVVPPAPEGCRGTVGCETGANRGTGLPRPSRLPAPRRSIRPPSVYSVAPPAVDNAEHY